MFLYIKIKINEERRLNFFLELFFKYYIKILCIIAITGILQSILRDTISLVEYNSSLKSTKKIYKKIKKTNEICYVPKFFTLILDFDEFENNYVAKKRCSEKKMNIVNMYPVNGFDYTKIDKKKCIKSHNRKNIISNIKIFNSDAGYSVYICNK